MKFLRNTFYFILFLAMAWAQSPSEDFSLMKTVIIQKNYMPKTDRWQLSGGLSLVPSEVFFKTFGPQLKAAYHFNETWGVELVGIYFTAIKGSELNDIENKQSVTAVNLANVKSYVGAQVYYNSMYGKYAFNDRKIVPFEIYQTVGAGQMVTDKSTNPALSLGVGQIVSLSRNSGLRVDLNLLLYQTQTVSGGTQSAHALLFTVGYSLFVPEVGKRW